MVDHFYELFAAGKIAESVALFSPDCIALTPNGPLNQDQHADMGHGFKAASPDSHMSVDQVIESGEEVVVMGIFWAPTPATCRERATIPASGGPLNLRFIDYFKVQDGLSSISSDL